MAPATKRAKLISTSLLIMLSISLFVGIVSEDATASEAAAGYPHLEAEYTVNPESISSIDDEVVVTLRIKGIGGKAEDLPPDILAKKPRKPLDVVLVLDKSGSMESTDYPPDRITAAKEAAKIFVNQIKEDDRVAVVSFSSSASTVVSFTSDKDSAKSKIGGISTGGGTAVGEGIITALDVLENGREESVKAIVLLSDGANNQGISPKTAANRAKGRGIPIYTVGIGTVSGGKDPLDEQTLKEIASITGGEYLYAPDESELKNVYEILSTKVLNYAGTDVWVFVEPTHFFNILKEKPSFLHFENIPPDTEKTVEITGKLTITAPNERIPIIKRFDIFYKDGIEEDRTIIGGPIYIEFDIETVPSDVEIRNIEFKRGDSSYEDATVYHLSDDIKAEVEIRNPDDVTVKSTTSIYEVRTGKGSTDSKETDKDSITHILNNGGVVGSYIFSDYLYYPEDTLTDCEGDKIYVVFDDSEGYDSFSSSDKYKGNKLVTLHPRTEKILDTALRAISGKSEMNGAAWELTNEVSKLLDYDKDDNDFNDDYTILAKGHGHCADYAALYISLARSVNVPVRGIDMWFDGPKGEGGIVENVIKFIVGSGHAFNEVYVNNKWIHAEPQGSYDSPDRYAIESGWRNIKCDAESEPGKKIKGDKLTTIKYAVVIDDDDLQIANILAPRERKKIKLTFVNRAKSEKDYIIVGSEKFIAKKVELTVEDRRGLDVEVKGLSKDNTLDIGESDDCTVIVTVPPEYSKNIKEEGGKNVRIKLSASYKTIDGKKIVKSYSLPIRILEAQEPELCVKVKRVDYGNGQIEELELESEYLPVVVACENGNAPFESMKAQAVAARTFAKYKIDHPRSGDFDVWDNESDQVYNPTKTVTDQHKKSVRDTKGVILKYTGKIICAFYVRGTGKTAKFVTYNEGKSGDGITQTSLGWVTTPPSKNPYNRGCMGQVKANELATNGDIWREILKYFYGKDISITEA